LPENVAETHQERQSQLSNSTPPASRKKPNRSQRWLVLLGILISALFLFLAFRGLQPEAFVNSLSNVQAGWLFVGALLYGFAVLVIAWRWQFLLNAISHVALGALTRIVAIGYMGNNVYPLRAGEALRIYLLKRDHGIRYTSAATTVFVERIFDGIVMLSFLAIGVLLGGVESREIRLVATAGTPIFVVGLLVFMLMARYPQIAWFFIQLAQRLLPDVLADRVRDLGENVVAGLAGLRQPLRLLGTILTSYATWAIEAVVYWVVMWAFGLELSYAVALLTVGTVNLAGLLPASPGQVGVYEFFVSRVLIAVGIGEDMALAYAIVVHIVIWLPVTLAGFFFLAQKGLSWRAIARARDLEAQAQG
jgi:uncharacterized protein (TIRG00374 family)